MKIFQHLSIKNKLIVFVLMISLLSITLGMTFVIFNNIKTFKDDMVYNTTTIAQFLAEACEAPLSFEFDDEIEKELKRLKGMKIVENGYVFNAEGQVYNSYSRTVDNTFTPPPPRHENAFWFEGNFLHVFRPIFSTQEPIAIGTLYIRASTAVLDKKINDYLMNMLIGLIGLIFITYFLAAKFQQVISQPILKLAKVTEHITRDADYSVRVEKEGEDEITTLYQGFNNMLEQLQVREQQRDLAEGEQKRLMVELGEKNKELEQVVYVTSHDLRSPLVNIQGFSKELGYSLEELSELLDTDAIPTELKEKLALILDEDVPDSLKFILSSTTKMDTLLSGLLKLSRVGRTATTFGDINMNELFTEISNAFEFQVKEGGIDLTLQEDLPPCFGNDVQLNQLFSNLVNNALKYRDMNKKGVIRIHGLTEEDGSVMYCVSDNGVGIQPDHQKKVFEIFHRLNPSETQGEGLGLSIVNKIVSRHSGKIWVESEWGKGSSFCVRLDGAKGVPSPKDQA